MTGMTDWQLDHEVLEVLRAHRGSYVSVYHVKNTLCRAFQLDQRRVFEAINRLVQARKLKRRRSAVRVSELVA